MPASLPEGEPIKPRKIRAFLAVVLAGALLGGNGAGAAAVQVPDQPDRVTAGVKAFDAVNPPSQSQLKCLQAQGYRLEFLDGNGGFAAGYANARSLGITVVAFQGYDPDAFRDVGMATTRAKKMIGYLTAAEYPKGSQVFVDIEYNNSRAVPGRPRSSGRRPGRRPWSRPAMSPGSTRASRTC